MPYVKIADDDPRCQLTAYVRCKKNLYMVVDNTRGVIVLENVMTDGKYTISRAAINNYTLVQAAEPLIPDEFEPHKEAA